MGTLEPQVGNWYRTPEGETFEVVALDESDGTVEVQHYDGTIEEYDLEAWFSLELDEAEPPEDWSGSLDLERADYGVDLDTNSPEDYRGSLEGFEREA